MLIWLGLAAMGCAGNHSRSAAAAPTAKPNPASAAPVPVEVPSARITLVRSEYKFVVIDFSSRALPPLGARLTVFRNGKRVGEVQITEPVRARFAAADILDGELRAGDEAR